MKLLVIVLCLLSERFLEHKSARHRIHWFTHYAQWMAKQLSHIPSSGWVLALMLFPLIISVGIVLFITANWLFGLVALIFNVIIFHFCVGPGNPFYPMQGSTEENASDDIGAYLVQVNGQLFAVLFWYIALGPLATLIYRLISLCQKQPAVGELASKLTDVLDWLPVRMTALLFMFVGNFQAGLHHFSKLLFSVPANNETLLIGCGTYALGGKKGEPVAMPLAESLVEHAVIMLLVLLSLFTLAAWV